MTTPNEVTARRRISVVDAASRDATDELLARLRADHWRPAAWARFAASSTLRSCHQARRHPRALAEATVLHAAFTLLAGRRGRRWSTVSWALTVSHLGLLDGHRSLGLPTAITLLRANLPAIGGHPRWLPILALASDLLDGRLARHLGVETRFGGYADSLADAAFWMWFVLRHEPSRGVRIAALTVWAAPVVVVTAASFVRGRMVDAPRPAVVRPAAAMQAVIAARAIVRNGQAPCQARATARVADATGRHHGTRTSRSSPPPRPRDPG